MTPREFRRWKALHAIEPLDDRNRIFYPAALIADSAQRAFYNKPFDFKDILARFVPALKEDEPEPGSFAAIAKTFKEA